MSKKKEKAKKKSEEHKRLAAARAAVEAGEYVSVEEFIEVEKASATPDASGASKKIEGSNKKKHKKSEHTIVHRQVGAPDKPSLLARLKNYFKGVITEMRRVVWPTRQEVINSTIIVLVTLVFFGIFAFVIDQISTVLMDFIIKLAAR